MLFSDRCFGKITGRIGAAEGMGCRVIFADSLDSDAQTSLRKNSCTIKLNLFFSRLKISLVYQ